jgi:hypothetical protein
MTGSSNCSNLKSVTGSRVVEYEVRKEISQLLLMVERYDQEKGNHNIIIIKNDRCRDSIY